MNKTTLTESQLRNIIQESIKDKISDFFTGGYSGEATNVEQALRQLHWGSQEIGDNKYDIYPNPFFGETDYAELKRHLTEFLAPQGLMPKLYRAKEQYHLILKVVPSDKGNINEIGDTSQGQYMLGKLAGRKLQQANTSLRKGNGKGYTNKMKDADDVSAYAKQSQNSSNTSDYGDNETYFERGKKDQQWHRPGSKGMPK